MEILKKVVVFIVLLAIFGCGGSSNTSTTSQEANNNQVSDPLYTLEYKGLKFYHQNLPISSYSLKQLSSERFNALSETNQRLVANKLLSTLFFGYSEKILQNKIDSGDFLDTVRASLLEDKTDKAWLEEHIIDSSIFQQSEWNEQEAVNILTRFYAMEELDNYFFHNWIAYILTQSIMFSPAYELESTHTPNITNIYTRLVTLLNEEAGMRYIAYVHMVSEDNWRRFRSPEDNGREMLEIFALDRNDSHVPIAGKALKNWTLDRDSDTLVVSLNQNTQPLTLFGTTIYTGDDFYRELVKSSLFTKGAVSRLVDFFFPNITQTAKKGIVSSIVSSQPETWQDILLQIVFSEVYLLENTRAKSAEETFFSFAKKMNFKHRKGTFHEFKNNLEEMHQASMKYKLGKIERVPLDTLSFISYYKYFRERIFLRMSDSSEENNFDAWNRQGWSESLMLNDGIDYTNMDYKQGLTHYINYLFRTIISREATENELEMFLNHMLEGESGRETLISYFDMFYTNDDLDKEINRRKENKFRITQLILEYLVRLEDTFMLKEVK